MDPDVNPLEAEHGRAIYCDAADSGPMQSGSEAAGDTGPKDMVGADGDRLEGGQGNGGGKGRRRIGGGGGGGGAGVDRLGLRSRSRHTGGERGRHWGGGVPGSKRLQWSGVERSGVERSGAEWSGVERSGAGRRMDKQSPRPITGQEKGRKK